MKALIFRGKVAQIVADDATFPNCCEWVDIPEELDPQPEYGWSYANGVFTAPPPPPVRSSPIYVNLKQEVENAWYGMVLLSVEYQCQVENTSLEGVQANLDSYLELANQLRDLENPPK